MNLVQSFTRRRRMRRMGFVLAAFCGAAALLVLGSARAQAFGETPSGGGDAFAPSTVYPGVREYRWTLTVPTVTTEHTGFAMQMPSDVMRPMRWDLQAPDFRTERVRIGKIPEFSC